MSAAVSVEKLFDLKRRLSGEEAIEPSAPPQPQESERSRSAETMSADVAFARGITPATNHYAAWTKWFFRRQQYPHSLAVIPCHGTGIRGAPHERGKRRERARSVALVAHERPNMCTFSRTAHCLWHERGTNHVKRSRLAESPCRPTCTSGRRHSQGANKRGPALIWAIEIG